MSAYGRKRSFRISQRAEIGLTQDQYEEFNIYLKQKCQLLLETLDKWLAMQEGRITGQSQEPSPKKRLITGVGIYHFLDP